MVGLGDNFSSQKMSSPAENPLSVWSGLGEMQNKLAGNIAKDLWSKHKPVRRLFGLLWRIGVAHKFLFLGGCAAMGAGWVRGAVREALMERIEASRLSCVALRPPLWLSAVAAIYALSCHHDALEGNLIIRRAFLHNVG